METPFRKLMILGGSGYVGRHLWARLGPDRATVTYNRAPVAGGVRFDLLSMSIDEAIADLPAYSHAVLLLADSQPDSCVADPIQSRKLNVEAMTSLIAQLADRGIKPIFASTELVFDGEQGDYKETDRASPILLYGQQKLEVERFLTDLGAPNVIFRFAKVIGDDPNDGTLFSGWSRAVRKGLHVVRCAADQAFSPIFVGDVVDAIVTAAERDLTGLFHLSGNQRFQRLELLDMFIAALRRHIDIGIRVEACSIRDFNLPEPRPIDVSMRCDKLIAETGFRPTSIEAICGRVAASTITF